MNKKLDKEEIEVYLLELCDTEPQYVIELFRILKEKLEQDGRVKFDENMINIFERFDKVFRALS
jgi:hypothetical protein